MKYDWLRFLSLFLLITPISLAMNQPNHHNPNQQIRNSSQYLKDETSPEARARVSPPALSRILKEHPEVKLLVPYEFIVTRAKNNIFMVTVKQELRMDPQTGILTHYYIKFRYNGNTDTVVKMEEKLPLK